VILGITAAALAATAVFNVHQARRVEHRNPPRGRFIEVDGVRLHYLEQGEGPPVVLLHGNVVTAEDFAYSGLLDLTAKSHRVIAFDRPGMGYSDRPNGRLWTPGAQADLLRRAFNRLAIERAVVVGHSLGAMVAAALALDHPTTVRGLVLLSGYFYPTARADVALAAPPAIPVLGDVLRYTVSPLVGRALLPAVVKGMFAPRQIPADFAKHFPFGMSVRPSQIRASAQDAAAMIPAAAAMRHRYRELSMPLVIMAGREDRVAKVGRQASDCTRRSPTAQSVWCQTSGTCSTTRCPRRSSPPLRPFRGRPVAPRTGRAATKKRRHYPEPTRDTDRFHRRGGRKRIVAPDGGELAPSSKPQPDGTLVKALARVALAGAPSP
jgi:pimeloyl-ACP methyl ester carboxylesterase